MRQHPLHRLARLACDLRALNVFAAIGFATIGLASFGCAAIGSAA